MKRKNGKDLAKKISDIRRIRKKALLALIAGIVLAVLGQLGQSFIVLILGYSIFLVCTAMVSFLTVLNWLYSRTVHRKQTEERSHPKVIFCPRCGASTKKGQKYCRKCGKNIRVRRR